MADHVRTLRKRLERMERAGAQNTGRPVNQRDKALADALRAAIKAMSSPRIESMLSPLPGVKRETMEIALYGNAAPILLRDRVLTVLDKHQQDIDENRDTTAYADQVADSCVQVVIDEVRAVLDPLGVMKGGAVGTGVDSLPRATGMSRVLEAPYKGDASIQPHPRWNAEKPGERHPQTVEEWNWHNDGPKNGGGLARSLKRLAVAADYDDPRAPDQMAQVLRIDLIRATAALQQQTTRAEAQKRRLDFGAMQSMVINMPQIDGTFIRLYDAECWRVSMELKLTSEDEKFFEAKARILHAMVLENLNIANDRLRSYAIPPLMPAMVDFDPPPDRNPAEVLRDVAVQMGQETGHGVDHASFDAAAKVLDEPISDHNQRIIRAWQSGDIIECRHIASTRWAKADPMAYGFDFQNFEYRVQSLASAIAFDGLRPDVEVGVVKKDGGA